MRVRNNEMMRLATPFPNLNNVIGDVPHDILWLFIAQGVEYFRRHRKTMFNPRNIRKNFGWFKIICHIVSIGITLNIWSLSERLHFKTLTKFCNKAIMYDLEAGYLTLCKTEPKLAKAIADFFTTLFNDYKIFKLTGVKSAFLQKFFPNMTP